MLESPSSPAPWGAFHETPMVLRLTFRISRLSAALPTTQIRAIKMTTNLSSSANKQDGEASITAPAATQTHSGYSGHAMVNAEQTQESHANVPTIDKAETKPKSAKELEKERKKNEKDKKFAEKQARLTSSVPIAASKNAEKKSKAKAAGEQKLPDYKEDTPLGVKKILKPFEDPHFKAYDPIAVESAWYSWWEKEGFFKPEFKADGKVKDKGYFVIPVPPPNVTGALHIGHALTGALQDTMIRWNRMKGLTTLWLPGCDHAGIATQTVVENTLRRKENKSRHDLGREKFTELIWEWKEDYHQKINNSHRRMGGSFDWTREAFTMDENLSAAVTETFVKLHEEGIIYRANRLVNWCTILNTALSNLEVDNKEIEGRTLLDVPGYDRKVEFGVLTHFNYEMDGMEENIEVATTRPETMLGDTAIAVHPNDERYKHVLGKFAKHPFVDRLIPIVADDYVDPEFGTGAVKITPAHDPNDFALGLRHKLEFINILNDNGTMNAHTGKFEGQKRFDVRYTIVEALKEKGLYVKKEDNPMKIPLCSRSKDVIEPIIRPQWWMKMRDLADAAAEVVEKGDIVIRPSSAEKNYMRWMKDIQDWCLSRQLWWGHQIPAYFIELDGVVGNNSDGELWVAGRTRAEAESKAKAKFPGRTFTLNRDPDVLDTWFSSALWPFSTLGWPKKTHDFASLYPTSVLETGWDILFFWVARMVMLGLKMTKQIPFKEVYCHPLVRDSEGRKMSKSLGNVVDPLDVVSGISLQALHDKLLLGNLDPKELERAKKFQKVSFPDGIPQCGADALRFSLVQYTTGGGDINLAISVIHANRKFCNKIYQATKYVLGKLDKDFVPQKVVRKTGKESLAERWILHKFSIAAKEVNEALEARMFSRSTEILYAYWYNHLCDVYIENSKALIQDGTPSEQRSAKDTLYTVLEGALTMMHPMMPFLTEELWQRLPRRPGDNNSTICKAAYPQYAAELDDPSSEAAYELVIGVAKGVRSLMAEYAIKDEGKIYVHAYHDTALQTATAQKHSILSLCGKAVTAIDVLSPSDSTPSGCVVFAVSSSVAVFLYVKGRVDADAEISKAQKKLAKAQEAIIKQNRILGGEKYQASVSEELKEAERNKLREYEAEAQQWESSIKQFEGLRVA